MNLNQRLGGFDSLDDLKPLPKKTGYVVKHPWANDVEDYSSHELDLRIQQRKAAENFKFKQPWDEDSEELLAIFEKQADLQDMKVKHPWDITPSVMEERNMQKNKAASYEYEPLWKPVEISAKQAAMIQNYKPNEACPFRREDNYQPGKDVPSKRMINTVTKTTAPWSYGNQAADPVTKKIQPPKPTSLWNIQPEMKKNLPFESSGDPILDNLRQQLFKHGANGILSLSKKFKIMDDDGKGGLDKEEFKKGMRELQLVDLSERAINHLFHYFDQDDSGMISLDEFLFGIRGALSPRRKSFVQQAFQILDKDCSGIIDYDDVKDVYDASRHPEVVAGRKSMNEILDEFLSNFEKNSIRTISGQPIQITWEEFERYYANISASIDDDDYFELMMRNAWHISGGDGWCGNTANRRVLVTHEDGRQSVQEITHDLGIKDDDKAEMMRLRQQGVSSIAKLDSRGGVGDGDGYQHSIKHHVMKPKSLESHLLRGSSSQNTSRMAPRPSSNQEERSQPAPPSTKRSLLLSHLTPAEPKSTAYRR